MQVGVHDLDRLACSDSISSLAERRAEIDLQAPAPGPDGTQPPAPGPSEEGGISTILIILPIVVVAGAVVFFILRSSRAKRTS